MADVSLIKAGRWGLSRPVQTAQGGWTTYAMQQGLGTDGVENYWPPRSTDGTPAVNAVLVRLKGVVTAPSDGNTVLFPRSLADVGDVTLGELTAAQRNNLRNTLEAWLTGYTFIDWDGTIRIIPPFTEQTVLYTSDTTLKGVARDVYRHFAHSLDRPRPIVFESHNTEYTDDFGTDPFSAPRWTNEIGTHVWDSTNLELDMSFAVSRPSARYSANNSGSIAHEAQVTSVWDGLFTAAAGAAVRMASSVQDWYCCTWDRTNLILVRVNGGSHTEIATFAFSATAFDFVTNRLAAEGAAGANVAISMWRTSHGASKPADPGWYGTDGSPNHTYTDTSVDRLDDSTHLYCGIAGIGSGTDFDSRSDFFKLRALSDRGGAAASFIPHRHPMAHMLVR